MAEAHGARGDLDRWLAPFLDALGHKKRRTWAPLYLRGLLGPGGRKGLQPMAARLGLSGHDRLHRPVSGPAPSAAPPGRVPDRALVAPGPRRAAPSAAWIAPIRIPRWSPRPGPSRF